MHAVLGDPAYYGRFGFELSTVYQITASRLEWQPHSQVRVLTKYHPRVARNVHLPQTFRPHLSRDDAMTR